MLFRRLMLLTIVFFSLQTFALCQETTSLRFPILLRGLNSKDWSVRVMAAQGLGELGPSARRTVPALEKVLHEYSTRLNDADVRKTIFEALGKIGIAAVPVLRKELLTNKMEDARMGAADALAIIGPPAKSSINDLMKALNDHGMSEDGLNVRWRAALALGAMGPQARKSVTDLRKHLRQDISIRVRAGAAEALGKICPPSDTTPLPELRKRIAGPSERLPFRPSPDPDWIVRANSVTSIGNFGSKSRDAVPDLIALFKDGSPVVISNAVTALSKIGYPAVPALMEAIEKDDPLLKSSAALALGGIGKGSKTSISQLEEALINPDEYVQAGACYALGQIGPPDANRTVPTLVGLLHTGSPVVQSFAARALGHMKSLSADSVAQLRNLLEKSADIDVISSTASALGEVKADDAQVLSTLESRYKQMKLYPSVGTIILESMKQLGPKSLPFLLTSLNDQNPGLRSKSAESIIFIGKKITKNKSISSTALDTYIKTYDDAAKIAANYPELSKDVDDLNDRTKTLLAYKSQRLLGPVYEWVNAGPFHKGIAAISLYLLFFISLWSLLLGLYPRSLVVADRIPQVNMVIEPTFAPGVRFSISTNSVFLLSFFQYHVKVLDAWIEKNQVLIRESFENRQSIKEREVYIPIPVTLGQDNGEENFFGKKDGQDFTPQALRTVFDREKICLVVWGEGGSGKTSLACEMARWAMDPFPDQRFCHHLMLPVFIEDLKPFTNGKRLVEAIQGQLDNSLRGKGPSEQLTLKLLEKKRLLVIVDRYSEMTPELRQEVTPERASFPVWALVITSRQDERFNDIPRTTLSPERIETDRISEFMHRYMTKKSKRKLFKDTEFFNECQRLSQIVGTRNATALLATLYGDLMVEKKEELSTPLPGLRPNTSLPGNIPELMLDYINFLNRFAGENDFSNWKVRRDAKVAALECLKQNFRPGDANADSIIASIGGTDAEAHLKYLKRLNIIQTVGGAEDVRFLLDPIAEYLAALLLIEDPVKHAELWQDYFKRKADASDPVKGFEGFKLALEDCLLSKQQSYDDIRETLVKAGFEI